MKITENKMNDYIRCFDAIDLLSSKGICNEKDTAHLKNELLIDIICAFRREEGEKNVGSL